MSLQLSILSNFYCGKSEGTYIKIINSFLSQFLKFNILFVFQNILDLLVFPAMSNPHFVNQILSFLKLKKYLLLFPL